MAKDSQVNIRFDAATAADLEETARQMGVSKSALVRHLTATFLKELKQSGTVPLHLKWSLDVNEADARSEWGSRKITAAEPQPTKPPSPVKYPKR